MGSLARRGGREGEGDLRGQTTDGYDASTDWRKSEQNTGKQDGSTSTRASSEWQRHVVPPPFSYVSCFQCFKKFPEIQWGQKQTQKHLTL